MARSCLRSSLSATISLAVLALASPAIAQDLPPEQAQANETASGNTILVTGLRRTDELQDTPAAITAFTSETIENARIVKPADFVKLREASLTAPIPPAWAQRVRLRTGTVSLTARNLNTLWTKYPGLDPEAGGQFNDNWTVPPLRYFLVRLNLTF